MTAEKGGQPNGFKALFTTAVWGQEYVERFLNYSLRTQLSAGNLGFFDRNSLLLLVTDKESIAYFEASPIYKELAKIISIECVDIDEIDTDTTDKYSRLTGCQNYALERAVEFDAIFFGYGDALWADGSYRAAAQRLMQGYDAVFSFGYPVLDIPFKATIEDQRGNSESEAVSIAPRKFAQMVYKNLHPMAHANRWDSEWMTHCPSYVVWDVPEQGLMLRSFHLHPVALRVQKKSPHFLAPFKSTLDEEFVARLNRTNPRIYVCPHSDEIGVCSLAEATDLTYQMAPARPVNLNDLANFAETYAGLTHRLLFNRPVRLVVNNVIDAKWEHAIQEAAALARDVKELLATPDSVLALENPAGFNARLQRQTNYQHWHDQSPVSVGLRRTKTANLGNNKTFTNAEEFAVARSELAAAVNAATAGFAAENFARSFQAMSEGEPAARPFNLRWILVTSLRRTVRVLHAAGVTRVIRVSILPMLPQLLRLRASHTVYRLGVLQVHGPRPRSSRRSSSRFSGFLRWLKQALRLRS